MADYFTNFSVIVPLKDDANKYAVELSQTATDHRFDDEPPNGFPTSLAEVLEDWSFQTVATEDGLWLHSSEGGLDAVCVFIQHILQNFNLSDPVEIEWSHDCSKPRTDAFGGGAAFITAHEIKSMSTTEWLRSVAA